MLNRPGRNDLGVLILLALFSVGVSPVLAQLPTARLWTVFPAGGKAGSSVEVAISGPDLDEPSQLHFSLPGIKAKPKVAEKSDQPEANKFVVTISKEVPPGLYDARFVGRYGASNPRAFAVGDLNEILEPASNNSTDTAAALTPGTTVNGHASVNTIDYFKLTAKKGQRILIECVARAIDSRMDAVLSLSDTEGRELENSRRGGLLDFTAPAEGEYLLQVHDFIYRGGDEYFYRLTASTAPRIDFVFPPASQPGTKNKFMAYGRNLPGGSPVKDLSIDGKPLEQLEFEMELPRVPGASQIPSATLPFAPPQAVVDGMEYRLTTPDGVSNPVLISLATAPVVVEQEPNNQPDAAQKISLPCEVAGQFYPANDPDWFTFDAKKGDAYWVEVFSARLGLPTSPFVLIQRVTQNDNGDEQSVDVQELYESDVNIGGNEFNTRTRDPAARFEAKEDGVYRVQVRDLFNRSASSPRHVYRLSLRQETPDFRLVALPQAHSPGKDKKDIPVWTSSLRRGETWPIKVLAFRRDGFNGDIELMAENLPPGVSASAARIESGKSSGLLLLSAAENASSWIGPLNIVGKAKAGDIELTRQARGGSMLWNVNDPAADAVQSRVTRDLVLAVVGTESAPISIAAENKAWEATKGGKLKIPFTVTRRGEFTANLKLKAAGLPALDSLKEIDVDGKATESVLELDLAQQKLSPGSYTFYLQTQTPGKYRNNLEAIQAAEGEAKEAEKHAAELAAAAKKAAEALTAAVQSEKEAEANAKLASEQETEDAKTKAKAATEAKAAAEKAANEASSKAKEAESKTSAATRKAKELTDKSKTRDVTITVYSAPITVKVLAAADGGK
ncbi:MAG TPA: hypothetical protein VGK40_13505 [Verrucomicrobiae bacterium]|jgi:hypothetical protein